jgi:hypothetical protein
MKTDFRFLLISLLLVFAFSMVSLGQETTGSLEITVKDAAGAVVPDVSITVTSVGTTGYKRTVTTDETGFVRVTQVPPGTYMITAGATKGFVEKSLENIPVGLGRATPVILEMSTTATANVVVTGEDVLPIDVTETKVQTTVSAQTAELLPKGLNFTSVLKVSPSTRPEPRSGQFQIDGASGSENTFIIDGQEVTNVRTGVLDANSNLPFSIIQEVQIKSSGFEAEYGGATGGVINIVTKGGGNDFHGTVGSLFRNSRFEPVGNPVLRQRGSDPEYYPSRRDHYTEFNPTVQVRGPIWREKIWFIATWAPQIFKRDRVLTYVDQNTRIPTGVVGHYFFEQRQEKTTIRLDAQPLSRLHLTGTFNWNPITQKGQIPGFTTELSTPIEENFSNNLGGRQNAMNVTGSGVYTVTDKLQVSASIGHYFLNEKLGTYNTGNNPLIPRVTCSSSSPTQFPPGFGCTRGYNNGVQVVSGTEFDATTRDQWQADASYQFNGAGRHELKGGYQNNTIGNKVSIRQTDQLVLRYGQSVQAYSGHTLELTPGWVGSGQYVIFSTRGNVTSKNEGLFIQDKWQPTRRLTLNLGVRTEREDVPSFAPGLPGMNFDFASKLAPRLGVSYDLSGDGKSKVWAFYGRFFDRFKYELPRGSFGGDEYHGLFFEILPGDTLATFTRATIFGSGAVIPSGACPPTGTAPVYGRVRCDVDFRIGSNGGGPITETGAVDPNIKPFRQTAIEAGYERQLWDLYVFSARYVHKQVDRTIEDAGFPNSAGSEYYIIGNPGEGLYAEQAASFGLLAPKPERKYDALELRLDRRFANNYYFNLNYTFSRLYGNYSGLSSSDEEGRLSPNVNRFFDQPSAGFTVAGGPDNGRLATDRPHVLKFFGAYRLGWERFGLWKSNETDFEVFTGAASGTLMTSFVAISNIDFIPLTRRGDMGRTPVFTETDFAIRHRIRFGRDNRFQLVLEGDVLNAFNQRTVTNRNNDISLTDFAADNPAFGLITVAEKAACGSNRQCSLIIAYRRFQTDGAPLIAQEIANGNGANVLYNQAESFQGPRQVRYGIRFIF